LFVKISRLHFLLFFSFEQQLVQNQPKKKGGKCPSRASNYSLFWSVVFLFFVFF